MKYPENDHASSIDAIDDPVFSKELMPILDSELRRFGDHFVRSREQLESQDHSLNAVRPAIRGPRIVLGDVVVDVPDVRLGQGRDFNEILFCHGESLP